jgi:integrase
MYLARAGLGWNGLDAKTLDCKGLARPFGSFWTGLERPVAETESAEYAIPRNAILSQNDRISFIFAAISTRSRSMSCLDISPYLAHKVGPKMGPMESEVGARTLNNLSATQVAKLKAPGRHSDGGGLYLFIDDSGRRRWIFMYTRGGKRTELGLGSARDLSLANARSEAAALRAILASGGDPRAERTKDDHVPTFGESADTYVEAMRPSWRNEKHAAQWVMTLTKYAAPMRGKAVDEITTQDVLNVLQPLWQRTPETAERLRGRIENVLDAAKARGHRSGENPARWRGHLDQLLPKRQRLSRGHHKALAYDALPAFMADLRSRDAVASRALEFLILTAARSGEVLGAQADEIDLEKRVWTIPPERMKAGREHRVPLSPRAIEILKALQALGRSPFLFQWPWPCCFGGLNPMSPSMGSAPLSAIGHRRQPAFRMRSARWR